MARIEFDAIDDTMVERGALEVPEPRGTLTRHEVARRVLEAALTAPPPKPEIQVSEGMRVAGELSRSRYQSGCAVEFPWLVQQVYVAMERQRLSEMGDGPQPPSPCYHRRKDDPK